MSCKLIDLLPRDGTNQLDRIIEALGFDYVKIEERTPKEWLAFAQQMALEINFYELNNIDLPFGTWENFFAETTSDFEKWYALKKKTQDLPAQFTLFVAFLKLLEILKDDLNKLTKRHLDFYYKDVLGFKYKAAVPDKVHLLIELATNVERYRLAAGTMFKAGKDESGKTLVYELEREVVFNQAKVHTIKTLYRDKVDQSKIYAAPVANSEDGLGAGTNKAGLQWSPFGENQTLLANHDKTMIEASIGLAIASPIFRLQEGLRVITLSLELTSYRLTNTGHDWLTNNTPIPVDILLVLEQFIDVDYSNAVDFEIALRQNLDPLKATLGLSNNQYNNYINAIISEVTNSPLRIVDTGKDLFEAEASTKKDWMGVPITRLDKLNNEKILEIELTVGEEQDSIVDYHNDLSGNRLDTDFPVLKLLLKNDQGNFYYDILQYLRIEKVDIHVDVKGLRDIVVQNDNGPLSPNGNFLPFGPQPVIGSSFYIGSHEVFSKDIQKVDINIEWHGKPDDLNDHYDPPHKVTTPVRQESNFTATTSILEKGTWTVIDSTTGLFPQGTSAAKINVAPIALNRNSDLTTFENYTSSVKRGFIKLDLNHPDFAHTEFPKTFTDYVLNNNGSSNVPNPPYTPTIKELSLDYQSSQTIIFAADHAPDDFFHLEVFGSRKINSTLSNYLLPQVAEGNLYIGVAALQAPQNLSLLFKVAEGSADPDIEIKKEDITWSFLSGNSWVPLTTLDILSDTTEGLQTSGIITIQISEQASVEHTLLPAGLVWLRAMINKNPAGTAKIELLQAQALEATWKDQSNAPNHLQDPLAAEQVRKLVDTVNEIKKVKQPYTSFGGKMAEQDPAFYARVSERLRHKQRLVTLYDAEHLVLEAFPEIYKCKTIPHHYQDHAINPGYATVVVIPNLRNKNAIDPLKPRVSSALRNKISEYLHQFVSPWVTLDLLNPLYEAIEFKFSVRFYQGFDAGYYANELNQELIRFLSPWAFEEGQDIVFGGQIHKSIVLDYIEELPYVDFVTDFILVHYRPGIGKECIASTLIIGPEVDVVAATTPRSILVSSPQHQIRILGANEEVCKQTNVSGIGAMIIESTFEVD